MPAGSRPSALARTGSKSTNHDWKSARAIASSVSFIRRFSSILSSSVPRMWAMALVRWKRRQGHRQARWSMRLRSAPCRLKHSYRPTACEHGRPRPNEESRIEGVSIHRTPVTRCGETQTMASSVTDIVHPPVLFPFVVKTASPGFGHLADATFVGKRAWNRSTPVEVDALSSTWPARRNITPSPPSRSSSR